LLYLGYKKLLYLLNRRLGGPESQSAHCRENKFSCPCRKYNSTSSSPYCHLTFAFLPYVGKFDCHQLYQYIACVLLIMYWSCVSGILTSAASNTQLVLSDHSWYIAWLCCLVCVTYCVCYHRGLLSGKKYIMGSIREIY
jgi:hypothetical protein